MPAPTERTRLRRLHRKAAYDSVTIHAILDAMPVAHVGYLVDGLPVVTPTLQWRQADRIYWHGSAASRMQRRAAGGPVCVTVTLTDGMVLARSGFEHSVSYRTVMVFGTAQMVQGAAAKTAALKAMMDQLVPGRWEALRPLRAQEIRATTILTLPLTEASAKVSAGFATETPGDETWPVWAGVIPTGLLTGAPVPASDLPGDVALPDHVRRWRFGVAS
jgi:nitroimidazol reductase NimA-like FMN-containing flavoprotein (pyridoxamine 5'-phosphate oxidase superfamily)